MSTLNPELEPVLAERYDNLVPDFAETLVEFAYGRIYSRGALDLRTRQIATVAALTALGGQTGPQLKVNIAHARKAGASRIEIAEVILQMSVYGGMPATINALSRALEVFEAEEFRSSQSALWQRYP